MTEPGEIREETGTQRLIGYVNDVSDPKAARCWLDVDDRHLNRTGVIHGGIIATLLDSVSGVTASLTVDASGRQPFVTLSFTTHFLAPGQAGRVVATARVTGGGRRTLFIDARLDHADGTLIATSTGVFKRAAKPG
jgi:acyl-coenzyme A thioesterase 13